jgi:acetyl esterase/lipase
MQTTRSRLAAIALLVSAGGVLPEAVTGQSAREYKDVVYATVDGKPLALDLYLPAGVVAPPLLVWVHGGAWNQGTKAQVRREFVEHGIATASVDFRQAPHPRTLNPGPWTPNATRRDGSPNPLRRIV